jgi:hypothetical protein
MEINISNNRLDKKTIIVSVNDESNFYALSTFLGCLPFGYYQVAKEGRSFKFPKCFKEDLILRAQKENHLINLK